MFINKLKEIILLRIITIVLVAGLIVPDAALSMSDFATSTLAVQSMFRPMVELRRGISNTIVINMKDRGVSENGQEIRKWDFWTTMEDNSVVYQRSRDLFRGKFNELVANSYDALVDKIDSLEIPSENFTGRVTIETFYDEEYVILRIIDNGKTVTLDENGNPTKRYRDSKRHFGGVGAGKKYVKSDLTSPGEYISWVPLNDGTRVEMRVRKEKMPDSFFINETECIIQENEIENQQSLTKGFRKDVEIIYFNLLKNQAKEMGLSPAGLKKYIREHLDEINTAPDQTKKTPTPTETKRRKTGFDSFSEPESPKITKNMTVPEIRSYCAAYEGEVYYPSAGTDGRSLISLFATFPKAKRFVFNDMLIPEELLGLTTDINTPEQVQDFLMRRFSYYFGGRKTSLSSEWIEENVLSLKITLKDENLKKLYERDNFEVLYKIGDFKNEADTFGVVYVHYPGKAQHLSMEKWFWEKIYSVLKQNGSLIVPVGTASEPSSETFKSVGLLLPTQELESYEPAVSCWSFFTKLGREDLSENSALEKLNMTEAVWGQTFIDTALIRADEAKKLFAAGEIDNPNIMIALETGLIPKSQRPYFQGMISELKRLRHEKGLDNLIIEDGKGEKLANRISETAAELKIPNSNIIFLGRDAILDMDAFDSFREGLDPEKWAFFAGVELPDNFPENNYIRLLEMLTNAVNLWSGKPQPADTPFMKIVQDGKRIYRFIIPEVEPVDYTFLQEIYVAQLKALTSA